MTSSALALLKNPDHLKAGKNTTLLSTLAKSRKMISHEKVIWSDTVAKRNHRGSYQKRDLIITTASLYNFKKNSYRAIKRKIEITNLSKIVLHSSSKECLIKVYNDYDYWYRVVNIQEMLQILASRYKEICGSSLQIDAVTDDLKNYVTLKKDIQSQSKLSTGELTQRKKTAATKHIKMMPKLEGWLTKCGYHVNKYLPRYFQLVENTLVYYSARFKGSVKLTRGVVGPIEHDEKEGFFKFTLSTPGKAISIGARDKETCNAWVKRLTDVVLEIKTSTPISKGNHHRMWTMTKSHFSALAFGKGRERVNSSFTGGRHRDRRRHRKFSTSETRLRHSSLPPKRSSVMSRSHVVLGLEDMTDDSDDVIHAHELWDKTEPWYYESNLDGERGSPSPRSRGTATPRNSANSPPPSTPVTPVVSPVSSTEDDDPLNRTFPARKATLWTFSKADHAHAATYRRPRNTPEDSKPRRSPKLVRGKSARSLSATRQHREVKGGSAAGGGDAGGAPKYPRQRSLSNHTPEEKGSGRQGGVDLSSTVGAQAWGGRGSMTAIKYRRNFQTDNDRLFSTPNFEASKGTQRSKKKRMMSPIRFLTNRMGKATSNDSINQMAKDDPPKNFYQGFLLKEEPRTKNMRRRLFVLHDDTLSYFETELKGTIPLVAQESTVTATVESPSLPSTPAGFDFLRTGFKYRFTVGKADRLYKLAADTEQQLQIWLTAIEAALSGKRETADSNALNLLTGELKAYMNQEAPTGDVALVFTDVQSSTKLWENRKMEMAEAIGIHDGILRGLLRKHRGYEVRTEGDAFFVVFGSTMDAFNWCFESQLELLAADWPENLLTYPAAAKEPPYWAGVRVRMGVHLARPNCRKNPIHGRMEYFGPAVNEADRIADSGHGGQVICTKPVVDALEKAVKEGKIESTLTTRWLGMYPYQGVKDLLDIYQVLHPRLEGRGVKSPGIFPELRIDWDLPNASMATHYPKGKSTLGEEEKDDKK
mmetsp:Transcript_28206/g.68603  ORF Transcript_28206/g.68603 Transcript_28206/m.68603 type:complete len:987 (-) Transcript_28206:151-3111(-)